MKILYILLAVLLIGSVYFSNQLRQIEDELEVKPVLLLIIFNLKYQIVLSFPKTWWHPFIKIT